MSRLVFRFAVPAIALLGVSCVPYQSSNDSQRLLVDRDAQRYGRVIQHPGSRVIPIVRGDGIAELFVPVQIGTSRGWWQIDTGAAFCVVTPRIGRHEGFTAISKGEIVTAAGAVDSQLGTLPSVRIGAFEIRQVTALSLRDDYAEDFTVHGRRGQVIGILGADLLDSLGATIDFRANLLRLRARLTELSTHSHSAMNPFSPELLTLGILCLFLSACVTTAFHHQPEHDSLSEFLAKDGRKVLTFVGYSGAGYQNEPAMLRQAGKILDAHDPKEVIVNLGVTPEGIGQIYPLAKKRGFTTMGIVSSQAKPYPASDQVDHPFYIEDETWGGLLEGSNRLSPTSARMVEHSDIMVGIGGGDIARDELRAAMKAGKEVKFFPADLNHQTALEKAKKKDEPLPTNFSGTAAEAF